MCKPTFLAWLFTFPGVFPQLSWPPVYAWISEFWLLEFSYICPPEGPAASLCSCKFVRQFLNVHSLALSLSPGIFSRQIQPLWSPYYLNISKNNQLRKFSWMHNRVCSDLKKIKSVRTFMSLFKIFYSILPYPAQRIKHREGNIWKH